MANTQTLQDKVQKATEKVKKCEGTIARHKAQLEKKIAKVEKQGVKLQGLNATEINDIIMEHRQTDLYWDICDVERKIDDIKGANKKLVEAKRILKGHQDKLQDELDKEAFIENNIPQVIKDFVAQWKLMAFEWHVKRYDGYIKLKTELEAEADQLSAELGVMPYSQRRKAMKEKGLDSGSIQSRLTQYGGGVVITMATYRNEAERLAWLEKTLEADRKFKLIDLMNRITGIVGTIVDAKALKISAKGNLDGIIKGSQADAKIETISAGGWNIQCFHYRTLVNAI